MKRMRVNESERRRGNANPECIVTKIERQMLKTKPDGRSYEIMYLSFKNRCVFFARKRGEKYIGERTEDRCCQFVFHGADSFFELVGLTFKFLNNSKNYPKKLKRFMEIYFSFV